MSEGLHVAGGVVIGAFLVLGTLPTASPSWGFGVVLGAALVIAGTVSNRMK